MDSRHRLAATLLSTAALCSLALTAQAGVITYGYDALGRLTKASYARGSMKSQTDVGYGYDARGNRLERTLATGTGPGGGTSNHAPDAVNDTLIVNMVDDPELGMFVVYGCVNVLLNDTDADNDPLSVTAGPDEGPSQCYADVITYEQAATFADSFSYTISDGQGGTDTATVNVEAE